MTALIIILVVLVALVAASVRILNEWERAVILRLGRALPGVKGPGLILLIPIIDRMRKVDTRTVTLQVPPQEIITRDNVSTKVTAVILFRVVDANAAITRNVDFMYSTSQVAQTSLRSILGQHSLDQLLGEREQINDRLQEVIDGQTAPWGVKVGVVEVKDVEIPEDMRRVLAKEAEAERLRRAKVIGAEGEFQAATRLAEAAREMATSPGAMQLRYLQTLVEIGAESNTTTVFPVPMNLLDGLGELVAGRSSSLPHDVPHRPDHRGTQAGRARSGRAAGVAAVRLPVLSRQRGGDARGDGSPRRTRRRARLGRSQLPEPLPAHRPARAGRADAAPRHHLA
jgi:hypothetical protein